MKNSATYNGSSLFSGTETLDKNKTYYGYKGKTTSSISSGSSSNIGGGSGVAKASASADFAAYDPETETLQQSSRHPELVSGSVGTAGEETTSPENTVATTGEEPVLPVMVVNEEPSYAQIPAYDPVAWEEEPYAAAYTVPVTNDETVASFVYDEGIAMAAYSGEETEPAAYDPETETLQQSSRHPEVTDIVAESELEAYETGMQPASSQSSSAESEYSVRAVSGSVGTTGEETASAATTSEETLNPGIAAAAAPMMMRSAAPMAAYSGEETQGEGTTTEYVAGPQVALDGISEEENAQLQANALNSTGNAGVATTALVEKPTPETAPDGGYYETLKESGTIEFAPGRNDYFYIDFEGYERYVHIKNEDTTNTKTLSYSIDENGQITFNSSGLYMEFYRPPVSASGYNIVLEGSDNKLLLSSGSDDTIINKGTNNIIDGGDGTDVLNNYGTVTSASNIETIIDWTNYTDLGTESGSLDFVPGESKVIKINGMLYYIENTSATFYNRLHYSTNTSTDVVTFSGGSSASVTFKITAADGQADNVLFNIIGGTLSTGNGNDSVTNSGQNAKIDAGSGNDVIINNNIAVIDAGDGNDSVNNKAVYSTIGLGAGDDTVTNSNSIVTIDGGAGTDVVNKINFYASTNTNVEKVIDWTNYTDLGTSSSTITVDAGSGQVVKINDLLYYIENTSTSSSNTLYYATNTSTGVVTFEAIGASSSKTFNITAADGQADNIKFDVGYGALNTGDGNDTVSLGARGEYSVVYTGCGDDDVFCGGFVTLNAQIYLGEGNDTFESFSNRIIVDSGDGNDSLLNRSNSGGSASYWLGAGDDTIINYASSVFIDAGEGNDSVEVVPYQLSAGWYIDGGDVYLGAGDDSVKVNASNIIIDAGEGSDSVTNMWKATSSIIDTGAGNDTIINSGSLATLNTGDGNDIITNKGTSNTIDGGDDTDVLNNYGTVSSSSNIETTIDWTNYTDLGTSSSSITVAAGSGQVVKINDLLYYVENTSTSEENILYYATNTSTDVVTFGGGSSASNTFKITAADGQTDNVVINGVNITFNAGDEDDEITINSAYNVIGGEGDDTLYLNENTSIGGVVYNQALFINQAISDNKVSEIETVFGCYGDRGVVSSDGVLVYAFGDDEPMGLYPIYKTSGSITTDGSWEIMTSTGSKHYGVSGLNGDTLNWSIDENDQITFQTDSTNGITITAADGQADNVIIDGANITFNAGDGDDKITINSANQVFAGDGDDSIINNGIVCSYIYGDAGNDSIINNCDVSAQYSGEGGIRGGEGNDTIINNGAIAGGDAIYGDAGNDLIINEPQNLYPSMTDKSMEIYGGADNDTIIQNGWEDNAIYGDTGDDSIVNKSSLISWFEGGDGVDTFSNTGNAENIDYADIEKVIDWTNYTDLGTSSSSITVAAGSGQVVKINDLLYYVENTSTSSSNTLYYATNTSTDVVTFKASGSSSKSFNITAADGQTDNINFAINYGTLNTGDENDTITNTSYDVKIDAGADNDVITNTSNYVKIDAGEGNDSVNNRGNYSTIGLGSGVDTITNSASEIIISKGEANSTDSVSTTRSDTVIVDEMFTMDFTSGQTQTVSIDNKTYTVTNNKTSDNTLSYGIISGTNQIAFWGPSFGVTAADGQADNIHFEVSYGILNTGDGNDSVNNSGACSTIGLGAGDDTIVNKTEYSYINIDTGDGNDSVNN